MGRLVTWLLGWAALAGLVSGCGGGGGEPVAPASPTAITTAVVGEGDDGAPTPCTEAELVNPRGGYWRAPSGEERSRADGLIAAADGAVKDSMFRDVEALIELARLQLWRDADTESHLASNDAKRARLNGQRAVAVDHSHAAARLVMALTTARSMLDAASKYGPGARVFAFGLVELAAQAALGGASREVAAAAHTLLGYLHLDRGQPRLAAKAFDEALALDSAAVGGWVGQGHVARARKDLDAAIRAYGQALSLAPDDPEARAGLAASQACEGLRLRMSASSAAALPSLTRHPLAQPDGVAGSCTPAQLAEPRTERLCRGRLALGAARTAADRGAAAMEIVAGWRDLRQACQADEPVCGAHVAAALVEASAGLKDAGQLAKSIATGRVVLGSTAKAFQAAGVKADVTLQLADSYYALGVYDLAAAFYERYLRVAGKAPSASLARRRAFIIRVALGDIAAMKQLAAPLAADSGLPQGERAAALLAAAELVRARRGPDAAKTWLGPHLPLLQAAGLGATAADVVAGPPAAATRQPLLLPDALRRLAADPRWSPGATRIADKTGDR